jgi:hypothetical protein
LLLGAPRANHQGVHGDEQIVDERLEELYAELK